MAYHRSSLGNKIALLLLIAMGFLGQTAAANVEDVVKGVNYDPLHSLEFAKGMGLDDPILMKKAIFLDLDRMSYLRAYKEKAFKKIDRIKTFFTIFASTGINSPQVQLNIADVVNEWNNAQRLSDDHILLTLGVYEFRSWVDGCGTEDECVRWTDVQIKGAIDAVKKYNKDGTVLIDKIIVGNEDIQDEVYNASNIRTRIIRDVKTIKEALKDYSIKVGTAQLSDPTMQMLDPNRADYKKYNELENTVDFLGTNIYPFWGGTPYGYTVQAVTKYWDDLTLKANSANKEILISEEGWPSGGEKKEGAIPNIDHAHDYFYYWYYRDIALIPSNDFHPKVLTSYYFSLFDNFPGQGFESHWGIFSSDGASGIFTEDSYHKDFKRGHVIVKFNNDIGKYGDPVRNVMLNACLEDVITKNEGKCYPIYGYPGRSIIPARKSKQKNAPAEIVNDTGQYTTVREFLIDSTGETYKSLKLNYEGDDKKLHPLCYVDFSMLSQFNGASVVLLKSTISDGNIPCVVSGETHPKNA